jgi:hypothetical protein
MERESKEWIEKLRKIFEYNPDTGEIRYKVKRGLKMPGDLAGQSVDKGYRRIEAYGERWMYHRVCWMLYHGEWPKYTIDHKNLDKSDNRLLNLRDITQGENNRNKARYKTNNKYKGVTKSYNKFYASFVDSGVHYYLGSFSSDIEAAKAYDDKAYGVRGPNTYLNFPEDYGLPPHKETLDQSN